MINDNDLLLLALSQNNGTYKVYIDSAGKKTLTPQTEKYEAKHYDPHVCYHSGDTVKGLLANEKFKKVVFPNCSKSLGNPKYSSDYGAFYEAFKGCTSLTSVSFPALISATGSSGEWYGAFYEAFKGCTSLTSVSFPALISATGSSNDDGTHGGAFGHAFENCISLTSISFPSLISATGGIASYSGAFYEAFYGCTSLTSISFPSLTSIESYDDTHSGAFHATFKGCTSLTSISFPSLTSALSGRYITCSIFYETFYGCTSLTSISFPSLTSVSKYTFAGTFRNCSPSLKVHFKKSMKGNTNLRYSNMGLKSADQVVFDLP